MNFDFFLKVNQFRVCYGQQASAEDFVDFLNYMLTPMILIFFAGISASKQYLFSPIQCWSVMETDKSARMEYIENLCWVENMYYLPSKSKDGSAREPQNLYYYQWVPFVLALQALMFYLPRVCWQFLSNRFGTSIMDVIRFSMSAATVEQDKRHKMVNYLAGHIEKLLFYSQPYRRGRWSRLKQRCARILPCLVLTKRTGFMLVGSYLLTKLLYVKNAILQLFIMQEFIGMNNSHWGVVLLDNLIHRRNWEVTGIFPRVAWCNVEIEHVRNTQHVYTTQCVLPNNMLNEKMYIFLWFWTWTLLVLTVCSFLSWSMDSTMRSSRKTFVKKYLKILSSIHLEEKALAKKFVNSFLRHDGVFILKMVSRNAGDLVTAEIVREIWQKFKSKKSDSVELDLPLLPPERPPRSQQLQKQQQQQHRQQVKNKSSTRSICTGSTRNVLADHQQQQQQQEDSASYV